MPFSRAAPIVLLFSPMAARLPTTLVRRLEHSRNTGKESGRHCVADKPQEALANDDSFLEEGVEEIISEHGGDARAAIRALPQSGFIS